MWSITTGWGCGRPYNIDKRTFLLIPSENVFQSPLCSLPIRYQYISNMSVDRWHNVGGRDLTKHVVDASPPSASWQSSFRWGMPGPSSTPSSRQLSSSYWLESTTALRTTPCLLLPPSAPPIPSSQSQSRESEGSLSSTVPSHLLLSLNSCIHTCLRRSHG